MARKRLTLDTARGEDRWKLPELTAEEILGLPASMEFVYAARALGINRTKAYEQASCLGALQYGTETCPVQRVGQVFRVKRSDLLRVLGIADPAQAQTSPAA